MLGARSAPVASSPASSRCWQPSPSSRTPATRRSWRAPRSRPCTGKTSPCPPQDRSLATRRLDELLAPELVSPPLRALLRKTGSVLDAAYSVDLRALRAAPLPVSSAAFNSYVQQVGTSFGIRGLEVFVSPALGPVCMPVSSNPPQLVFGQALLDSEDDAARYFLMIRSLKIVQGHAAALSRTAPIELWPVLAAFLSVLAPDWIPQGVDARKLGEAQKRIQAAISQPLDGEVPVLALEVIGAIGNRASLLGTALHQWATARRCSLRARSRHRCAAWRGRRCDGRASQGRRRAREVDRAKSRGSRSCDLRRGRTIRRSAQPARLEPLKRAASAALNAR